jgi:hypothetical protein
MSAETRSSPKCLGLPQWSYAAPRAVGLLGDGRGLERLWPGAARAVRGVMGAVHGADYRGRGAGSDTSPLQTPRHRIHAHDPGAQSNWLGITTLSGARPCTISRTTVRPVCADPLQSTMRISTPATPA